MSNGEFLDDFMRLMYQTFGSKPKDKPGADENPPRNFRCGDCERWVPAATNHYASLAHALAALAKRRAKP